MIPVTGLSSPSGDVWSLGIVKVQTQYFPSSNSKLYEYTVRPSFSKFCWDTL